MFGPPFFLLSHKKKCFIIQNINHFFMCETENSSRCVTSLHCYVPSIFSRILQLSSAIIALKDLLERGFLGVLNPPRAAAAASNLNLLLFESLHRRRVRVHRMPSLVSLTGSSSSTRSRYAGRNQAEQCRTKNQRKETPGNLRRFFLYFFSLPSFRTDFHFLKWCG